MKKYLMLVVLLIIGCDSETVTKEPEWVLVENSVMVRYGDSNCLQPVVEVSEVDFVIYDSLFLYEPVAINYFSTAYWRKVNGGCYKTIGDYLEWVGVAAYPLSDEYKVMGGLLYVLSD